MNSSAHLNQEVRSIGMAFRRDRLVDLEIAVSFSTLILDDRIVALPLLTGWLCCGKSPPGLYRRRELGGFYLNSVL